MYNQMLPYRIDGNIAKKVKEAVEYE